MPAGIQNKPKRNQTYTLLCVCLFCFSLFKPHAFFQLTRNIIFLKIPYKKDSVSMKLFCELVTKEILPVVRSFIAEELLHEYKLNQTEIANRLGISQPAVSQYLRRIRGGNKEILGNEEIRQGIKALCQKLYDNSVDSNQLSSEFCKLCNFIKEKLDQNLVYQKSDGCVCGKKDAAASSFVSA